MNGFRLAYSGEHIPASTVATWHDVLVVDGLAEDTLLLSVHRMRDSDGINMYFNPDNSAYLYDCMRFPDGVIVPFISSSYDIGAKPLTNSDHPAAHTVSPSTQWPLTANRSEALRTHAALCHAGSTRISMSNVVYNSKPVHSIVISLMTVSAADLEADAAPATAPTSAIMGPSIPPACVTEITYLSLTLAKLLRLTHALAFCAPLRTGSREW